MVFFFSFPFFRETFLSVWKDTYHPDFHVSNASGFQTSSETFNRWWTETCDFTAPSKPSKAVPTGIIVFFLSLVNFLRQGLSFDYFSFSFTIFFSLPFFFLSDWNIFILPSTRWPFPILFSIVFFASSCQIGIPRIDSQMQHAPTVPYQRFAGGTLRIRVETHLPFSYSPSPCGIHHATNSLGPFWQSRHRSRKRTLLSYARPVPRTDTS